MAKAKVKILKELIGNDRFDFLVSTALEIKRVINKYQNSPIVLNEDVLQALNLLRRSLDEKTFKKVFNSVLSYYSEQKGNEAYEIVLGMAKVSVFFNILRATVNSLLKDGKQIKLADLKKEIEAKYKEEFFEEQLKTLKAIDEKKELIKEYLASELEPILAQMPLYNALFPERSIKRSKALHHVIFLVYFLASDCIILGERLDREERRYWEVKNSNPATLAEKYKKQKELERLKERLKNSWIIRERLNKKWSLIKHTLLELNFGNFDSDNIRRQIFNRHKDNVYPMYYALKNLPDSNLPEFEKIDIYKTVEFDGFPHWANGNSLIPKQ
ncbi:MAG: hypothetical protein NZ893_03230 [Candidatus Aenigmarchaeota archaeon]|nr:hypothetical protein [Candidatus Aenigmarchaeota archaeon]